MKRVCLLAILALALTACSSGLVRDAYPAAGDGTSPADLEKTTTFRADDDLNIVVTLGAHSRTLSVYTIFISPQGTAIQTDPLEADETVGKIVQGLDWESQGSQLWPAGEWKADVYVDDARQKSVTFTVQPELDATTPEG